MHWKILSVTVSKNNHIARKCLSLRNGEILPAGGDDTLLQPSCKSSDSLTRTILWAHSFISKWRKSIIKHVSVEFRSSLWRVTITPRITENTWDCSHLPIHTTQSILKHLSSLKAAFIDNRTQFLQKKLWVICIATWLVTCYIFIWYAIIKSFIRDIVYQFMHSLGIKNTILALLVLCYTAIRPEMSCLSNKTTVMLAFANRL